MDGCSPAYYGYRDMGYHQAIDLISCVHWPDEKWDFSFSTGHTLSNLKPCLFAKMT